MKLLTYSVEKNPFRVGILINQNKVIDPQLVLKEKLKHEVPYSYKEIAETLLPEDPIKFISNGEYSMNAAQEAINYSLENNLEKGIFNLNEVTLGPPVLRPNKIVCVGLNYADHIREMNRDLPKFPVIFAKYSGALNGPYAPFIYKEPLTEKLDYEGELAVIIGKKARNVSEESALDYVVGYTVSNDITARDMQKRTIQWLQGKTLEGSLPIGPWLVTKDEIVDPHNLDIQLYVNGELRQKSNTKNFVFDVNYLVSFLSEIITLEPGDIICTGTPGGVGEAQNKFLRDKDIVRVDISGIGTIENQIKVQK
ncbi:fumarylacetoacetate hydrolase family protein [Lysinibacillus capsici]|uniref:fumarylacetoacetate hydrolase family protein n=1 Tax=Lysinibacillus capsici TaxID=2115968 RepID=UPI0036C4B13E